jgi:hypothetical protein
MQEAVVAGVTEQVLAFLAASTALFPVDGTGGHHQMHVPMVVEPACVRVQYRDSSRAALQVLVVLAELIDRFPGPLGDEGLEGFLILPRQVAPLFRQGEGDHEIVARKLFGQLALYPLLGFVGLAVRAIAVSAGMGNEAISIAF